MARYPLVALLLVAVAGLTALELRPHLRRAPPRQLAATRPSQAAAAPANQHRLPVTAAQSRAELAAGGLLQPVQSLLSQQRPMHYGSWRWDEQGVAAGPAWVRIDLETQLISVFRGGDEIGTAVVVYGTDGLRTPTGVFPIKAKARDHRSSLYDAPMPFTLRLTDDGVSIHGSTVRYGAATHGCIGVPLAFAERLFNAVATGDRVLILPARKRAKTA